MQLSTKAHAARPIASGSAPFLSEQVQRLSLACLLVAATLLLYRSVVNFQFIVFDDPLYALNRHVISGFTSANVHWAFRNLDLGNWHPLAWLSHMLDSKFFGTKPAGPHYINVLLHAANVFLLFALLTKVTGSKWRSFMVAALFAVHPLNVENVAWVAERKTLLCTLFCFLMLAAYGWYAKAPSWIRYLLVVVCFVLALMSKAMAVTMPVTLLLVDYWPLDRFHTSSESLSSRALKLVAEKLPLFFISAAFSCIALIAQRSSGAVSLTLPLSERLRNATVSYVAYLGKACWPTRLSVYYPYEQGAVSWLKFSAALLILAAITTLTIRFRRQRYLAFGWLFFLSSLLPVIGLIQIGGQSMADRYTYTPLIGIFIAVVWEASYLCKRFSVPSALVAAVAFCVLAALSATMHNYLGYWHDSLALFTKAQQVAIKPDRVIETQIGVALNESGHPEEAMQHFRFAVALDPHCSYALYNIGTYTMRHGKPRESLPYFQAAIMDSTTDFVTALAFHNMGSAYLRLHDYDHAERSFTAAMKLDIDPFLSLVGRGQAFYSEGNFDAATSDFLSALQLNRKAGALVWLGKSLQAQHKSAPAFAAYTEALKADPNNVEAQTAIASMRSQQ